MTQSRATGLVLTLLGMCVLPLVTGCAGIGLTEIGARESLPLVPIPAG